MDDGLPSENNYDIKMKIRLLSLFTLLMVVVGVSAQGAFDFKISEVYIASPADSLSAYQDEYGETASWIEIENTSYTTRNIRNCFLTTNRAVLNEELSAPERIAMMAEIKEGDERTSLAAKQRITFFADGKENRGVLHLSLAFEPGKENFLAFYDGNGVTLLDTLVIPALEPGHSYSRTYNAENDEYVWVVTEPENVTPNTPNIGAEAKVNKVAEWKEKDPHGVAMAIISMAIVFGCLLLLYIFFHIFGWVLNRANVFAKTKPISKIHESASKVVVMAKDGTETKGIEMENYVAVISMALHEYYGNTHDMESGILTIRHGEHTAWESKDHAMRQSPIHHHIPNTSM